MKAVWLVSFLFGITFPVLSIRRLLAGAQRRYPFLLAYLVALVLTTVAESAVYLQVYGWSNLGFTIYYIDDMILQVLIFAVVISLISRHLEKRPSTTLGRPSLVLGALVVMVLCIALAFDSQTRLPVSMTEASRNLSFASAILNLILWSVLLGNRGRDSQLMILSGGIGLQTAGRAIGHSLRTLKWVNTGDTIMVVTFLLSLVIIWYSLRTNGQEESR